jgi:tellurite resistance protein TerB
MPYRHTLKRYEKPSWDEYHGEFRQTRDRELMEAVVAGCAVIAYADGWVTVDERRRMLGLIRGFGPIASFTIDEVSFYLEEVTSWFEADHDGAERQALEVVARLRGRPRYPERLVQTCCAIADADGGFDAEERKAALRICEILEVDAAGFELADA